MLRLAGRAGVEADRPERVRVARARHAGRGRRPRRGDCTRGALRARVGGTVAGSVKCARRAGRARGVGGTRAWLRDIVAGRAARSTGRAPHVVLPGARASDIVALQTAGRAAWPAEGVGRGRAIGQTEAAGGARGGAVGALKVPVDGARPRDVAGGRARALAGPAPPTMIRVVVVRGRTAAHRARRSDRLVGLFPRQRAGGASGAAGRRCHRVGRANGANGEEEHRSRAQAAISASRAGRTVAPTVLLQKPAGGAWAAHQRLTVKHRPGGAHARLVTPSTGGRAVVRGAWDAGGTPLGGGKGARGAWQTRGPLLAQIAGVGAGGAGDARPTVDAHSAGPARHALPCALVQAPRGIAHAGLGAPHLVRGPRAAVRLTKGARGAAVTRAEGARGAQVTRGVSLGRRRGVRAGGARPTTPVGIGAGGTRSTDTLCQRSGGGACVVANAERIRRSAAKRKECKWEASAAHQEGMPRSSLGRPRRTW